MAPIHFGALVYDYQAIDVFGPFDLLNSSTKPLLEYFLRHKAVERETVDRAPQFIFHHVGENLDPFPLLTSSVTIVPTDTVDNCPDLDYLLIGGPMPEEFKFPSKYVDFIKSHVAAGKIVYTTCTGAAALATTGVLDGKNATVNNVEYDWIAANYPNVKWTKDKKWVVDGNIWTGSGAVAGMDMFAHWIQINYGLDVLTAGAMALDYEPRDINGLHTVLPQRHDGQGKQLPTHVFP